jgi:hypothetical protein
MGGSIARTDSLLASDLPSMQAGVSVPGQEAAESVDHSAREEPDYSETALEEKWISYQRQLGTVFQNIIIRIGERV